MMKKYRTIDLFIKRGVGLSASFMLVFLAISSLVYTESFYFENEEGGYYYQVYPDIIKINDNIIMHIIIFIFAVSALLGGYLLYMKIAEKKYDWLIVIVAGILTVGSVYWVSISHTKPVADSATVMNIAEAIYRGDYSVFDVGGYLHKCKHQISLVILYNIFFELGAEGYRWLQYLNAALIFPIVIGGYSIVKKIGANKAIQFIYMCLITMCLPLYFYVNYCYHEIIIIAFTVWIISLGIDILQSEVKWYTYLLLCLLISVGGYMRATVFVAVIAIGCSIILRVLESHQFKIIFRLIPLMIGCLGTLFLSSTVYKEQWNGKDTIPNIALIAMGLEENDFLLGPGAYNASHTTRFEISGYNANKTAELAMESIKERVNCMMEAPVYATRFFIYKQLWQWGNPDCLALEQTAWVEEEPTGLVYDVYYGWLRAGIFEFMNYYQSFLYIGALIATVILMIKPKKTEDYLLMIFFIGGFLFTAIWESKPRYILLYYVLLVPYASTGYGELVIKIRNVYQKVKGK